MAEVVRDGIGNRNSSPTFLFSVWGHPVRKSGNEHDQFAVAVLEDETLCTASGDSLFFFLILFGRSGPLFVHFVGGPVLGFHDIRSRASFGNLL